MDHILTMFRRLAQFEAQYTLCQANYEQAKDAAIPEHIRTQLAAIAATFQTDLEGMALEIEQLKKQCKAEVCAYGRTVKGAGYTASYVRGRVTWDNAFLQGYGASHPEILQGCKEGEPYVMLRKTS